MDATDRKILELLVRNGRVTHTELGRAVGLSPHAAADRVRRLVQAGVITGFTAVLDHGALGRQLEALIDARLLPSVMPEQFEQMALRIPSVQEVAFTTGRFDYQLRVACDDADDLDQTVRLLRQKAGVAVTETRIILRSQATHPRVG